MRVRALGFLCVLSVVLLAACESPDSGADTDGEEFPGAGGDNSDIGSTGGLGGNGTGLNPSDNEGPSDLGVDGSSGTDQSDDDTGMGGAGDEDSGDTEGQAGRAQGSGGSSTGGSGGSSGSGSTRANTNPDFKNLAPKMGQALDGKGTALTPKAPEGWVWYPIEGAICRDGSPTGFYVRHTNSDKLIWYLEGGGACTSPGFCAYNQANVNEILSGAQETCVGSVFGTVAKRQEPGKLGIFDTANSANPVKDWNMIYVPYCTGDVHFGTRRNVSIPGVDKPQHFVGYLNMQKFIARIVPTFKSKVKLVILTGSSAGGFAASLNYSIVQDSFGSVPVKALNDSGPPFEDKYMPTCMQKRWREMWGFDDSFPPDCKECRQADGGGMANYANFLMKKHPNLSIGLISSIKDEIIRVFYAMGNDNCSHFEKSGPVYNFMGNSMPGANYEAGLEALRKQHLSSGKYAAYFISGTKHQHLWRARLFESPAGGVTIANWLNDFINGKNGNVGP